MVWVMRWLATGQERPAPRIDYLAVSDDSTAWLDLIPRDSYDYVTWDEVPPERGAKHAREVTPFADWTRAWKDGTGAILLMQKPTIDGQARWRLELPGLACACRELDELLALPGKPQRVDIAIDTDGPCTPQWFMRALGERRIISRWRTWRWTASGQLSAPEEEAATLEIGDRAGACFLRIYDKLKQLLATGRSAPDDLQAGKRLTRIELELKHHAAALALDDLRHDKRPLLTMQRILEGGGLGKFRVCSEEIDRRQTTRAETAPEYAALFDADSLLKTSPPDLDPATRTARRIRALLRMSRALALVAETGGEEYLAALVEDGLARWQATDGLAASSERDQAQLRAVIDEESRKRPPQ